MRRLVAVLGTALMLSGGWLSAASAADAWNISNVDVAPGTVSFTVSGVRGAAIPAAGSIAVTADGKPLTVKVDADAPTPEADSGRRVAYLVVDVSGSMAGPGIAAARKAARDYVAAIPDDVELGLVTFSDTVKVAATASPDHQQVLKVLNGVRPEGDTALYDAVRAAVTEAKQISLADERRLLILSDGADTSSDATLDQAVDALKSNAVQADVVAFRVPGDRAALDKLSASSQGRTLAAENADNLAKAFRSVAATFAPRLRVTAKVPDDLAGTSSSMVVSGVADGEGWETQTLVTFSPLKEQRAESSSSTGGSISSVWLGPLLLLVFGVLLVTFLGLLSVPARTRVRELRTARIAEAGRYRVGAVGLRDHPRASGEVSLGSTTAAINVRALRLMDKRLRSSGSRGKVLNHVEGAGLRMRPEEWAVLQLCVVIVTAVLATLLTGVIWLLPLGGLLGWLGCRIFLRVRRSRREVKFQQQIPDTLQLLAGSLRAGFSLPQALGTVVREGTEPTASELNRALTESRLGANLEDALDDTAQRMNCVDLGWVVIAIRISREVGGNLAEVMDTTVATMRERAQLRGLVRVLTAEGRLSAWILSALPFLVGAFLLLYRPGYFDPMVHTVVGLCLLAGGAALLSLGIFWLSRLVRIEV